MLNILLMIILTITIIISIILFIGVKIKLKYVKDDEFKGCLKVIILKKINIYTLKFPSQSKNKKEKEKENINIKKLIKLLKPCLNNFLTYLKSILKSIKIKNVQNHLIFGMDNFADTGKYIGMIWAILAIINSFDKNLKLSAEPSFTGSTLKGYGENEIEIYPLKLIKATITLLLNKDVRNFIRGIRDD